MQMFKKLSIIFFSMVMLLNNSFAQRPEAEMADGLRSDGKIWVVIGVIVILFAGLFVYLINTDRRLRRIEKQIKEKH